MQKELKFLNIVYLQFQIEMSYWCCIISLVYYCDWTRKSHYDKYRLGFIHIFQKTELGLGGRGFISSQSSTKVCSALANEERVSVRDQWVIRAVCADDTQSVSSSAVRPWDWCADIQDDPCWTWFIFHISPMFYSQRAFKKLDFLHNTV